jgi:putative hydrolase of the HAD superfamily
VLGLVSDGYLEAQQRKWAALDIDRYFRAVVFSDELGRAHWKPSPLPYRTVLDRLMIAAERAVYVGDNPTKDFRGARLTGMSTIRVRRHGGLYAHLEPSSPDDAPDAEISDVSEICSGPAWAMGNRREAGCIT